MTSGGAIPDNADYDVIAEPDGTFVGTVNEDFAIESVAGDVFLLGNTPWKIRRVESGRVRVEDAQGSNPTLPFWLGEAPGRTPELSDEVSDLREDLLQHQDTSDGVQWLMKQAGIQTKSWSRTTCRYQRRHLGNASSVTSNTLPTCDNWMSWPPTALGMAPTWCPIPQPWSRV